MKKGFIILIYFFLIISISSGCKKRLFDFRNKYLGNWTFIYIVHDFYEPIPGNILFSKKIDTTYNGHFNGSVSYGNGYGPLGIHPQRGHNVYIHFLPNNIYAYGTSFELDKSGQFVSSNSNGSFIGKNEVAFNYTTTFLFSGEGVRTMTVTGTKTN